MTVAGQSIKADDFAINTLGKGKDLLQIADSYDAQADAEDEREMLESEGAGPVIVTTRASIGPDIPFGLGLTSGGLARRGLA